jgi:16S rRNA (uracil1498-N3)-methyltransferase
MDRYQKIIESAMKQSLHYYLPKLNEPILLKDFLKIELKGQKYIAHCEETNKKSLKSQLLPNEDVTLLIGPEGDFSVKEIEMALNNKYIPISLGETRLRTETAAIVACHSVVFINN